MTNLPDDFVSENSDVMTPEEEHELIQILETADPDQIAMPAYVWRVGPASEWGSREIVDGEPLTPDQYTVGDRIGGPIFGPGGLFPNHDISGEVKALQAQAEQYATEYPKQVNPE